MLLLKIYPCVTLNLHLHSLLFKQTKKNYHMKKWPWTYIISTLSNNYLQYSRLISVSSSLKPERVWNLHYPWNLTFDHIWNKYIISIVTFLSDFSISESAQSTVNSVLFCLCDSFEFCNIHVLSNETVRFH